MFYTYFFCKSKSLLMRFIAYILPIFLLLTRKTLPKLPLSMTLLISKSSKFTTSPLRPGLPIRQVLEPVFCYYRSFVSFSVVLCLAMSGCWSTTKSSKSSSSSASSHSFYWPSAWSMISVSLRLSKYSVVGILVILLAKSRSVVK